MSKNTRILTDIAKSLTEKAIITDQAGIDLNQQLSYPEALKASLTKKPIRGKITWFPIIYNNEVLGTVGLKNTKEIATNKKFILELVDRLEFEDFTKTQAKKIIDAKSSFVRKILTDEKIKSLDFAIDSADILGLNLRSPQAIILIKVPGLLKKIHQKVKHKEHQLLPFTINEEYQKINKALKNGFRNFEQNIFVCLDAETIVCLKWARGEINTLNTIKFFRARADYIGRIVLKETGIRPTIGIGQYYPGISGLRKSYSDAQISLELGEKIWGTGRNYHITDVGMLIALSRKVGFDRKCELANQIIGPIFDDSEILKTVTEFLDLNMNLTDVSKKMKIHRNTLIYRLEKIKKETGLDPRLFTDAIQIKLGLILYRPQADNKKNC